MGISTRFYPSRPPLILGEELKYFFLPLFLGGDVEERDRGVKNEYYAFLPLILGGDVEERDRGGKKRVPEDWD
jgi:hypothetical protein